MLNKKTVDTFLSIKIFCIEFIILLQLNLLSEIIDQYMFIYKKQKYIHYITIE